MQALLVIPDDDARTIVGHLLTAGGIAVVSDPRNETALPRLAQDRFDCVIAEVHPTQDGAFNLLYAVREHRDAGVADTPFVIVATRNRPIDRLRAWEAGCDAFLAKPVHVAEIVDAVRGAVDRSPADRARFRRDTFEAERRRVAEEKAAR